MSNPSLCRQAKWKVQAQESMTEDPSAHHAWNIAATIKCNYLHKVLQR